MSQRLSRRAIALSLFITASFAGSAFALIGANPAVITKSFSPASVALNGSSIGTITVTNPNAIPLTNVQFSDVMPAGIDLITQTGGTCSTPATGGGIFSINPGTETFSSTSNVLTAGQSCTITFSVKGTIVGPHVNTTSQVTSAEAAPGAAAQGTLTVIGSDVAIAKTGPATAVAGTNVVYALTVSNSGSDATGVSVSDVIPANTSFVSAIASQGSCTGTASVVCTLGTILDGGTATVTLTVNVDVSLAGGSTISNTATVTSTTADPNPVNNSSTFTTNITGGSVDLAIVKTASAPPYGTGFPITWTIGVSNAGPAPAAGVVVTDTIPAGTSFVSATPTQGTCTGTSTVTCNLGTLASGGAASISLVLNLPATAGPLSNVASVTSSNPDTNAVNNSSTSNITVIAAAAIPALSPSMLLLLVSAIVTIGAIRLRM
jgi:uncharacterized repeat protein (TIGR01451 family)